jgi:hypothetical protein
LLDAESGEATQIQHAMSANEPQEPTSRPALLDAIDSTVRIIEDRARLYRNLVMAVSTVSVLSILMAILFRQWIAFSGLVLLVPLTGGFLILDSCLVRRWRTGIIEMKRVRSLDVVVFQKTVSGFRHFPPNSLKAMLSTLPVTREENRHETPQPEQASVGANFDALDRKTELKILNSVGLLTIALICLVAGVFYRSLALLLSGGSSIILLAIFAKR